MNGVTEASLRTQGERVFKHCFDVVAEQAFFAPGRVNLIGEHIDYNGGLVLPCAIDLGIYAWVRYRKDRLVRCFSQQFSQQGVLVCQLEELANVRDWRRALAGALWQLEEWGHGLTYGFDLLLCADLPLGSGLSSSAALLVLLLNMLTDRQQRTTHGQDLALAAQRVEQQFLGTPCGIMDQYVVANGRAGQAMLLDCATLECRYLPFFADKGQWSLLVANSNKPRKLADSEYRLRREQCGLALHELALRCDRPLANLCQARVGEVEQLADECLRKRARHVVSEQQRTEQAAHALQQSNGPALGRLLNASHQSLRDDYQVSCPELDALVEGLCSTPQVAGARMTGAGFGGCVIALVKGDADTTDLSQDYQRRFGYPPTFYRCHPSAGVREIAVGA